MPSPPPSLRGPLGSKSTSFNHPMRNRLTAAGLGLAMSKSLRAGTRRVSEKVDLTMHRILERVVSFPPPKRTWGTFSFMSRAVIAQSAPWDLEWGKGFVFKIDGGFVCLKLFLTMSLSIVANC